MASPRRWLSFLVVALTLSGCPRRFDPRAAEIHSNNPEAEAEFRAAQRKFQDGELDAANLALRLFLTKYGSSPSEPLLPMARLLDGRVARAQGQLARAREVLTPLADGSAGAGAAVTDTARFELGMVSYRLGEDAQALRLLGPFSGQIVDGDDATELHAVLADLAARGGNLGDALREFDAYFHSPQVRPVEQAYIRAQVRALIGRLPAGEQRGWADRFGVTDVVRAADKSTTRPAEPSVVVGLVLPLSGKERALGERVLRGALWAASGPLRGAVGRTAEPLAVDLRVRDSASSAETAATATADLLREGVQALVASPVKAEAVAVGRAAESAAVPLLQLSALADGVGAATGRGTGRGFALLQSNEARAARLAGSLRGSGLTTVAVLAPGTPYGQNMTRAFVEALRGSAVQVVGQLTFPAGATTFTAQTRQLLELRPQALFLPVTAAQLELIAGQLAALAVLATQRVEKRETEPPVRLLLSTAEGLSEKTLTAAGRYLQGALLSPVAMGGLAVAGAEDRFVGYGPDGGGTAGALDSLGFDAVETLRGACLLRRTSVTGTCSAEQLLSGLRQVSLEGTTGTIAFEEGGKRRGGMPLLRVEGGALRLVR